jgi:hypothetical protein
VSQGTNQKQIEKEGVIMRCKTLRFSAVLSICLPILAVEAQDVDVPGNLTMRDSTGPTVGNILKAGVPFIHNFGTDNRT